jgi:hypothetical protein
LFALARDPKRFDLEGAKVHFLRRAAFEFDLGGCGLTGGFHQPDDQRLGVFGFFLTRRGRWWPVQR